MRESSCHDSCLSCCTEIICMLNVGVWFFKANSAEGKYFFLGQRKVEIILVNDLLFRVSTTLLFSLAMSSILILLLADSDASGCSDYNRDNIEIPVLF